MRVEIVDVHERDDFFEDIDTLIGIEGDFQAEKETNPGFYSGELILDEPINLPNSGQRSSLYFYGVKIKIAKEKPKIFDGPATRVKCVDNLGIEDLLTLGRNYDVYHESKTLYHIRTNKNYVFFFPKNKFIRLA
jgi:hypothetical protein